MPGFLVDDGLPLGANAPSKAQGGTLELARVFDECTAPNVVVDGVDGCSPPTTPSVFSFGPGGGAEFVFKKELRALDAEYRKALADGADEAEAAKARDSGLAGIRAQYERELMNPKEALALGSVSRLVMPGTSRRVLASNFDFLIRTYEPTPMAGPQRESPRIQVTMPISGSAATVVSRIGIIGSSVS